MSIPMTAVSESILDVMALVDEGLFPFAHCDDCHELMPVSVDHGLGGGLAAFCCKCQASLTGLHFLSQTEAGSLGWKFELVGERPLN